MNYEWNVTVRETPTANGGFEYRLFVGPDPVVASAVFTDTRQTPATMFERLVRQVAR